MNRHQVSVWGLNIDVICVGFLAMDESSMMTTSLLTLGSQMSGRIWNGDGAVDSTNPFRGLNMILMGDFRQFKLVGKPHEALYSQSIAGRTENKRLLWDITLFTI